MINFTKTEDRGNILVPYEYRKWDKVFKNGPSKICERQPLKNLK